MEHPSQPQNEPSPRSEIAQPALSHSTSNPLRKVHYRPLEAAVRWSGLFRFENHIQDVLKARRIPTAIDFPIWPNLRLNIERIYDGLINRELPFSINGVVVNSGEVGTDHPDLTVRHVDLKSWMTRFYPDQRPRFLFSRIERQSHPTITMNAVQALLVERDALWAKIKLSEAEPLLQNTRRRPNSREQNSQLHSEAIRTSIDPRGEMTYLHIIGGLLDLLLGRSPGGQRYSRFKTQESVISALIAHHGQLRGITERTLQAKFAAAKRELSDT